MFRALILRKKQSFQIFDHAAREKSMGRKVLSMALEKKPSIFIRIFRIPGRGGRIRQCSLDNQAVRTSTAYREPRLELR